MISELLERILHEFVFLDGLYCTDREDIVEKIKTMEEDVIWQIDEQELIKDIANYLEDTEKGTTFEETKNRTTGGIRKMSNPTKIMISRPMRNKTKEEIDKETNEMKNILFEYYSKENIEIIDSIVENHTEKSELECFGESIIFMSQVDILAMGFGWENSRGCKLEHEIAKAYNLPVVYLDSIKKDS